MNDVAIMSNNVFNNDYIRIEGNEEGLDFNKSNILYCNDDCTRITCEEDKDVEGEDVEEEEEEEDKDLEGERENTSANIYRYKFTQEIMDELHNFSKVHQFDDRVQFKEAWQLWTVEFDETIRVEVQRLSHNGYEGDIVDKMFKSARYYFRKKSSVKPEVKERREYVSFQKDILILMDQHINSTKLKPADGFTDFCNTNMEALKKEIAYLLEHNIKDSKQIQAKFKKTYKNRYFLMNK
jgi:hypothetical protein